MKLEAQFAHLTIQDPLTGLPNRRQFEEELRNRMNPPVSSGFGLALFRIDLDGFRWINEGIGYSCADALLAVIARRLKESLGKADLLARTGDDEFSAIVFQIADSEAAGFVTRGLLDAFREPFHVAGCEVTVTASIGVSLYPADGETVDALERQCDIALHDAKSRGKNGWALFNSGMRQDVRERMQLEAGLHRALERRELFLVYQPQFDLERNALVGSEALLRWKHPDFGTVPPSKFIPLAEQSGMIVRLGQWVLTEACRQNRLWRRAGMPSLRVAVNVSPVQFARPDFVKTVATALEQSGMEAGFLELELTERLIMHHVEESTSRMAQLRALGVRISLDDFGTGYSSLSQLQRLPIDVIKIDRSFLGEIDSNASTIPLIEAVVALGHSLGMTVLAEGIETQRQLEILRTAGCDLGQGYLMGKPGSPDQIRELGTRPAGASAGSTILLVDDEEMVLSLVRQVLRRRGYHVLEARNGRDALTICKKHQGVIDLLITDVLMPGTNGYELARDISSLRSNIKVIYISGYADDQPVSRQHDVAEMCFLAKPFGPESLTRAVYEALAKS